MAKKVKLKLDQLFKENNNTQKEMAEYLNLSPSTVNDLCTKDIKRVNTETLAKIAEKYNITDMNKLMTIENKEQK